MSAAELAELCRATAEAYTNGSLVHDLEHVGRLIEDFYALPGNGAGGSLHIVLDDGNVGVDSIEFCQRYAKEHNDETGYWLATLLLTLTDEERDELLDPGYCGACCADLQLGEQHVCPGGLSS